MPTEPPLVLDTDFVSSFAWVGRMDILATLYSGRMLLLEEVMEELNRVPYLAGQVRVSVEAGHILREEMLVGSPEALQFIRFHEAGRYGVGEAACMAYILYRGGILASNSLSDVEAFCVRNGISLLTTPDVLRQLYEQGRLSIGELNHLWVTMLARQRKLPAASFSEYLGRDK